MRLAILTDLQGNLPALERVLDHARASGADRLLCLGDLATGPFPGGVVDLLLERRAVCVRGNMDEEVLKPGPPPDGSVHRRFAEIDAWCLERLSSAQRAFLAKLPGTVDLDLDGGTRLLACHGSPTSPEDVIGPGTPDDEIRTLLAGVEPEIVAVGHLHEPMLRRLDDHTLLHPGSVGWPPSGRSGLRPLRATYAILESGPGGDLHVGFYRLDYDREPFRRRILASGMPHAAWYIGLWA